VPEKFICTLKLPSINPVIGCPNAVIVTVGLGLTICCETVPTELELMKQFSIGYEPGMALLLNENDE
jgi:hypothetical protein